MQGGVCWFALSGGFYDLLMVSYTHYLFFVPAQNLFLRPIDKGFFICYISGIISSAVVFVVIQQPCLDGLHIALL
jgi:hypothetical protein